MFNTNCFKFYTGNRQQKSTNSSFYFFAPAKKSRRRAEREKRGTEHTGLDFIRCFVVQIIAFCDADYGYLRMAREYTLF